MSDYKRACCKGHVRSLCSIVAVLINQVIGVWDVTKQRPPVEAGTAPHTDLRSAVYGLTLSFLFQLAALDLESAEATGSKYLLLTPQFISGCLWC